MVDSASPWPAPYAHLERSTIRKYAAQSTILFQGEIPPLALFVAKGYVAAYTINNNGDEQIVGFFSAFDALPAEWIFAHSPVSLYYYRAFTDCELAACPRDVLRTEIASNAALAHDLLERYVTAFITASIHIHALEHSHAHEKLIKVFHYMVLRFGESKTDNQHIFDIPFPLTHAQIASMIGLTRETVALESLKLKKRGALDYKKGFYSINLPRLLSPVGSEEFDTLTL